MYGDNILEANGKQRNKMSKCIVCTVHVCAVFMRQNIVSNVYETTD